ncbi:uncharacterized protein L201_006622 [Kwoniella dendrophila CBS 6074]|uniref:Mitochondrial genome maintenance protein MGM101 n=1 Tax=Kwoniella dendrophila CBS 6074 TaxID=1295534 RepID=A0AAX4K1U8_9TREE
MSLISSTSRLLPRSSIQQLRAISTTSSTLAVAASSSSSSTPTPSRYVRKTVIPSRSTTSSPRSSTSTSASSTSAAAKPRAATTRFTPTPNPTPTQPAPQMKGTYDDFPEDFPLPSTEPIIDDYSHLNPSSSSSIRPGSFSSPEASPPLTSLSNENYQSLPSASGPLTSIEGEAKVGNLEEGQDWSSSFSGLSEKPFPKEVANELLRELKVNDVEIKPDGLLYLPEIKYRRTLNAAFGPGGWGLAPRGETHVGPRIVSREWGLVCLGRLVSIARGEQEYFDASGIPTATEACKSNALMRCCKDLGIASELWDPSFIRDFKLKHCKEVYVEHATKKQKKKLWRKKDGPKFEYPWRENA